MTRQELDAALARIGIAVPAEERDEIAAAAHYISDMAARLRRESARSAPSRRIPLRFPRAERWCRIS